MNWNQLSVSAGFTGGNTDVGTVVFTPALIKGAFLSYGKKFSLSDKADMKTAIENATKASSQSNRLYPIHNFTEAEDKSQDRQTSTSGYGDEFVTRDRRMKDVFRIYKGQLTLHIALKKHSDVCTGIFLIDEKNRLLGWEDSDGNLCPYDLNQLYVTDPVRLTGSNVYYIGIELAYSDRAQHLESFAWFNADSQNFTLSSFKGIKDVELVEKVAVDNTGVVTVNGKVGPLGENLRTLYGASLANSEAWVMTDADGTVLAMADPVSNSTDDGYDCTVPNTPWTAAATGDVFYLKLAPISALQAAPVSLGATVKIESNTFKIVKPA